MGEKTMGAADQKRDSGLTWSQLQAAALGRFGCLVSSASSPFRTRLLPAYLQMT